MGYDETWVYNYDVTRLKVLKGLKGSLGMLGFCFVNMFFRLNAAALMHRSHGSHPWACSWKFLRTLRRCKQWTAMITSLSPGSGRRLPPC